MLTRSSAKRSLLIVNLDPDICCLFKKKECSVLRKGKKERKGERKREGNSITRHKIIFCLEGCTMQIKKLKIQSIFLQFLLLFNSTNPKI